MGWDRMFIGQWPREPQSLFSLRVFVWLAKCTQNSPGQHIISVRWHFISLPVGLTNTSNLLWINLQHIYISISLYIIQVGLSFKSPFNPDLTFNSWILVFWDGKCLKRVCTIKVKSQQQEIWQRTLLPYIWFRWARSWVMWIGSTL